jgi:hypothetical protein
MHVGARMLKYPSLMGVFPLPPPSPTTNIAPINMISSYTSGLLGYVDPWVVPWPNDIESYEASIPPTIVEMVDSMILSASTDTSQHLHPHMECDQPTPPIQVVDSSRSHDFIYTKFP